MSSSRVYALVAALLCAAAFVPAQTITGIVSGSVTDPSGQAVPGASVTLVNEATNETRIATTDVAPADQKPSIGCSIKWKGA